MADWPVSINNLTGTPNQVIVSSPTGASTLSLPQNIHTGAVPQFAGLGIGQAQEASTLFSVINQTLSAALVMADFIYSTTASSDISAGRFLMEQLSTGNSSTRAAEFHNVRATGVTANSLWGIEIGVHSQVSGNGVLQNVGAYIHSDHTGWLSSGVRNDSAIAIVGADGWTNGIIYYDTDGSTVLYKLDQHGAVTQNSSLTITTSGKIIAGSSAGTSQQYLEFTSTGGDIICGIESSAGGSILSGGLAYATILESVGSHALQLGTVNAAALTIDTAQHVGIGTTAPATSALLELASTTGALLVPRMTTTQKNALTPVDGMIVYDTTIPAMQGRVNGSWITL